MQQLWVSFPVRGMNYFDLLTSLLKIITWCFVTGVLELSFVYLFKISYLENIG